MQSGVQQLIVGCFELVLRAQNAAACSISIQMCHPFPVDGTNRASEQGIELEYAAARRTYKDRLTIVLAK